MRSAKSFASKATSWEILAAGVQPHLAEMPHMQEMYGQLQEVMVKARELDSQQESARALARELTRQRQDLEKVGESLRARMSAYLRASFGFTSEQLIKFGINPRPRVTRRRSAEPDAE